MSIGRNSDVRRGAVGFAGPAGWVRLRQPAIARRGDELACVPSTPQVPCGQFSSIRGEFG